MAHRTFLAQSPKVFWNSEGLTLELDDERARQTIFNQAQAYNQVAWLGAAAGSFEQWWQTEAFTLEPGATAFLKFNSRPFYQRRKASI